MNSNRAYEMPFPQTDVMTYVYHAPVGATLYGRQLRTPRRFVHNGYQNAAGAYPRLHNLDDFFSRLAKSAHFNGARYDQSYQPRQIELAYARFRAE